MAELPSVISRSYEIATASVVRSWSYGELKAVRSPGAVSWREMVDSLDDQRIFGPIGDFVCACGKYKGARFEKMICDVCGVKVASSRIRRSRFGHIELRLSVAHPYGNSSDTIVVFPVLPIAFVQSESGSALANLYEDLLHASQHENDCDVALAVSAVCNHLLPIASHAHAWNMSEADLLTRGLGLVVKSSLNAEDERCPDCGYALGGLPVTACPGCGGRINR